MKNKYLNIIVLILIMVLLISLIGCSNPQEAQMTDNVNNEGNKVKPVIAVSIVPQESFVKAVAGDKVDVITMIPPGHSPTNYQPTPKEMMKFSEASVYFSIGVPTEEANILPKVKDLNKNINVIHLDKKVSEIYADRYFGEVEEHSHDDENSYDENSRDPHIWLSPKRVKVMIETIKDELIKLDPKNKLVYEQNAINFIEKLEEVDESIKYTLKEVNRQSFIVYHPSFGYFADEYGLIMMPIEENGKEATVKRLQEIIDYAKKEKIKVIFYQAEFDSNQAESIASEIEGEAIKVDPLAHNYIENLEKIAETFKNVLEK